MERCEWGGRAAPHSTVIVQLVYGNSTVGLRCTAPRLTRRRAFDLLYASRLLTDGYGFEEDASSLEFRGEIGGAEATTSIKYKV